MCDCRSRSRSGHFGAALACRQTTRRVHRDVPKTRQASRYAAGESGSVDRSAGPCWRGSGPLERRSCLNGQRGLPFISSKFRRFRSRGRHCCYAGNGLLQKNAVLAKCGLQAQVVDGAPPQCHRDRFQCWFLDWASRFNLGSSRNNRHDLSSGLHPGLPLCSIHMRHCIAWQYSVPILTASPRQDEQCHRLSEASEGPGHDDGRKTLRDSPHAKPRQESTGWQDPMTDGSMPGALAEHRVDVLCGQQGIEPGIELF